MASPVKREFPLDKFIAGVVAKLVKTYKIPEHQREDMIQDAWVTVFRVTRDHPKKAKNKGYLMRAIVNDLLKSEARDRAKRSRNLSLDNTTNAQSASPDTSAALIAKDLLEAAGLTDSEKAVCELIFDIPGNPSSISTVARLMEKSESWVSSRLSSARLKLGITAERV